MQINTLSVFEIFSDCKVEAQPGEIIIWDGGQFGGKLCYRLIIPQGMRTSTVRRMLSSSN